MQFFLPCAGFGENENAKYLEELFFVDYDTMSKREKAKIDEAIEHGDLYVGALVVLPNGLQVFSTDLGSPSDNARVEIHVPGYVPKEKAVWMLANLVNSLMDL